MKDKKKAKRNRRANNKKKPVSLRRAIQSLKRKRIRLLPRAVVRTFEKFKYSAPPWVRHGKPKGLVAV